MQNTTYYCDICGKEMPAMKLSQAIIFGYNMDFCIDCEKKLRIKFKELQEENKND